MVQLLLCLSVRDGPAAVVSVNAGWSSCCCVCQCVMVQLLLCLSVRDGPAAVVSVSA